MPPVTEGPKAKRSSPLVAPAVAAIVKAFASPVWPLMTRRALPASVTMLAVTPDSLALIARARPSRLSFVLSITTSKLLLPTVMVIVPWPTGSVRLARGADETVCAWASWATSTDAERLPRRAPATADAVKTLVSDTLG